MSGSTPADCDDTPAAALGPVALFLGLVAAVGLLPWLTLFMFPVMLIGGGLAVTFGLMGVHYAGRGIGRRWISVTGAVLGALALAYPFVVLSPFLLLLGL
jgi:hypothetical protein